jgi:hypothetical protein
MNEPRGDFSDIQSDGKRNGALVRLKEIVCKDEK